MNIFRNGTASYHSEGFLNFYEQSKRYTSETKKKATTLVKKLRGELAKPSMAALKGQKVFKKRPQLKEVD